jgi:hypothetical protein
MIFCGKRGRYMRDPLADYDRGRKNVFRERNIEHTKES